MAEMTAKQAIAVLHNNQYQKHIANGEYDYIHPLTDAECKGIESLIQQQQQKIEQLKCCGNCGNWEQFDEFGSEKIHNCIANKKLTWRERFDKCDKWEVAGNG